MRKRRTRARLHGPERNSEFLGHFALREVAPVRERDHLALTFGQRFQRAVHAPLHPRAFGALVGPGLERRLVRCLGRRLVARAAPVDDRVARDAVQPRRTRAALGLVGAGGAPDGDERLLECVLGAAAVAEATQREAEDWPGVTLVQLLERGPIARAGPLNQLPVRAHG